MKTNTVNINGVTFSEKAQNLLADLQNNCPGALLDDLENISDIVLRARSDEDFTIIDLESRLETLSFFRKLTRAMMQSDPA